MESCPAYQHLSTYSIFTGGSVTCNVNIAPNANFVTKTGEPVQHQALYEEDYYNSAFDELIRDLPNF